MTILIAVWLATLGLVGVFSATGLATANESLMLASFFASMAFWFEFTALLFVWLSQRRGRDHAFK